MAAAFPAATATPLVGSLLVAVRRSQAAAGIGAAEFGPSRPGCHRLPGDNDRLVAPRDLPALGSALCFSRLPLCGSPANARRPLETLRLVLWPEPPTRSAVGITAMNSLRIHPMYGRADALDDGALIDVTPKAQQAGFRAPVALTRAAWDLCVAVSSAADRAGYDEVSRLFDVLWTLRRVIVRQQGVGAELVFEVIGIGETGYPQRYALRARVGPDDERRPVVTILLATER